MNFKAFIIELALTGILTTYTLNYKLDIDSHNFDFRKDTAYVCTYVC